MQEYCDPRWDIPLLLSKNFAGNRTTLRDALQRAGNRTFILNELINSEYGNLLINGLETLFISEDPADEKIIRYWQHRGLRKECLWGGPQPWNQWEIFTPLSAYIKDNASRKYPVVFALHGGGAGEHDGATIFFTECSYAYKAAENEFILALLDDHDDAGIMRLYEHLILNYPVDISRVYLAGYSAGSNRSVQTGLMHPELFAGLVIGAGLPFSLEYDDKLIETAKHLKLPFVAVGCLNDKGNHTPFYRTNPIDNPMPAFVAKLFSAENKMRWINAFFDVNHIPRYTLEENRDYLLVCGTPEEKRIGLRAQSSHTYEWAGKKHLSLDYVDAEGMQSARYVFIEGMPHFEPPDLMDIGWRFVERFSRRPSDHTLICSGPLQGE